MAHLTIVTKRPSMIQWPMQRNVYTLVPSINSANKSISSNQPETTCNTNTSRMFTATVCQPQSSSTGSNTYDDSLTNLSWLHDINILKRAIPVINSSNNHHLANDSASDKPKESSIVSTSNSICSSSVGTVYPNDIDDTNDFNINNDEQWRLYRANPHAKPIYSYSQLILLAMRQSGHEKMTLQMIYEWVAENFPYFKKMEPTWQNSIRHNLSLNKCFIKVARTKKETSGKGGFWKLSPDYDRQRCQTSSSINSLPQYINATPNKRSRPSKRSDHVKSLIKNSLPTSSMNHVIKSEAWIDPILPSIVSKTHSQLHCQTSILDPPSTYIRMPSSLLSPISSPDSLAVPPFYHQQQISDFSSVLTPSPSSPSSMSSAMAKQSFLPTKLDETDMLLLDAATFDWDAYLCETPNDIDVQPLLCTKTEQDLFNEFNAALTDLTSSAEAAAAAGSDSSAFDGFDYSIKSSTFHTLFEDEEQQSSLTIKGRGIKRPAWWLTNDSLTATRLPSLESAFDLKLSK